MIRGKLICKGKVKIPIGEAPKEPIEVMYKGWRQAGRTAARQAFAGLGSVSHVPELNEKYQGMEINRVWGDEVAKFTVDDWESFGERLKRLKEPVEDAK